MDVSRLRALLGELQEGRISIDQTLDHLRTLPYENLGHARLDLHRS